MQTEDVRLKTSINALAVLLRLAEKLRRTNAAKWEVTEPQWQAAVQEIVTAPVPHLNDFASVFQALRAAQNAGTRLGNSGVARFASVSVGRHPDSSLAGERFYDDVDAAKDRLEELRQLILAEPKVAPDCGGIT